MKQMNSEIFDWVLEDAVRKLEDRYDYEQWYNEESTQTILDSKA